MVYKTGKKERITDFLKLHNDETFTLEEICEKIAPDGKGRSTVYRLVSSLVDGGEVCRLSDGKTRRFTYQYLGRGECHSHFHLKCNECGRLIHLDSKISHELGERLASVGGFSIEEGATLHGRCRECSAYAGNVK